MNEPPPRQRALAVVAEDEPILRLETLDFLSDEGFDVVDAGNAALALAEIERLGGVNLLFTDVRMPGSQDGAALAREVARRWPGTRIVVCSALPRPQGLPDGCRFFDKPFLPAAMRKALRSES